MRGLEKIPSKQKLLRAYNQLLDHSTKLASIRELCLWSQWTRFDPRLAELLISYICKFWKILPAPILNETLKTLPWPATFAVLCEYVKDIQKDKVFNVWMKCIVSDIPPAKNELYFIGLQKFGGRQNFDNAVNALKFYRKWGFLSREYLTSKGKDRGRKTLLPKSTRLGILKELLQKKNRITTQEYRQATHKLVSIRQAQRDLKKQDLRAIGQTRGRIYIK